MVLITTTKKTRDKSLRASCILLIIARIPRTPSTMNTGCDIDVSSKPPSHSAIIRILNGKGRVSPITPVIKSRYCKMATCMVPSSIIERNTRRIPSAGKNLPKAVPIIPRVIPASNTLTERKNTILSTSLIPAKPIRNAGAINTAVKIKIGIMFF